MSVCDPFRERFKAAASDFLCGLKGELVLGYDGDVGEGNVEPSNPDIGFSEEAERVLGPKGTVKLGVEAPGDSAGLGCGIRCSGTSSAGGISRPRAAAMI